MSAVCCYPAGHVKKEYQINALQKLTGIAISTLASVKSAASYLEQWLPEPEQDTAADAYLSCTVPPLFAMPEKLVWKLSKRSGNEDLTERRTRSVGRFQSAVDRRHLTLLLPPRSAGNDFRCAAVIR